MENGANAGRGWFREVTVERAIAQEGAAAGREGGQSEKAMGRTRTREVEPRQLGMA